MKKNWIFLVGCVIFLSMIHTPGNLQNISPPGSSSFLGIYACEDDLIEVMFDWESKVRLRNGTLVDLRTNALQGLDPVLSQLEWHTWYRISDVAEEVMDAWSDHGSHRSGNPVYNLNNIYRLHIPKNKDIWQICRQLGSLPGILSASPVPKPVELPVPPNYQSNQGYLNPASSTPTGIDALYAWTQTGGMGSGVTVCDLEYSWNYNHADITKAVGSQINTNVQDPFSNHDHGTAVIGVLVADNNGWGTTGICYGAGLKTCGTYYGIPVSWNVPGAIAVAISNLSAGDIILLEQQWDYTGSGGYVPIEWWTNTSSQTYNGVYAAIVNAVANGIHVVEAGGNGNVNTDGMTWYGNSGAIIVGAGGATVSSDLKRLSFSSYGQRFDLQGWGENVFTTGYGTYYNSEGVNYYYTSTFNGTSSASPVVAGALACAEGYYLINISSIPPSPSFMRTHLSTYGTAQVMPPSGNIGPRPDLFSAITNFSPPSNNYDWGDAPDPPYQTLSTNFGANHLINPGVYMGGTIDPESNGQPGFNADGDDLSGFPNDEDGMVFTSAVRPGITATLNVTASVQGYLNAWIDFNKINGWSDPGEQIIINQILYPGINSLSFNVPLNALIGITYARFRFATYPGLTFLGSATDGEVEDYLVYIDEPIQDEIDWGDAPDAPYPTLLASNGANHLIDGVLFLGNQVDGEPDGQPDPAAQGDDMDLIFPPPNDDEDGVIFTSPVIPNQAATVDVIASKAGILNAWIDFNVNGTWADPNEQIFTDIPLNPGLNNLVYLVPQGTQTGPTYARFRLSTSSGLSYTGFAPNGEVEDYHIIIQLPPEYDFGDAPDPTYPTLQANNGAAHAINPALFMGTFIDTDPDGQPDSQALGDDNHAMDDEDGITFTQFVPGGTSTIAIQASSSGFVSGWIDYDRNGDWAGPNEQVLFDQSVSPGLTAVTIQVPSTALIGKTFARFRYSTAAGLTYLGIAPDGEVEDYEVLIEGDVSVNLKVLLEGPFQASLMSTMLNAAGWLPLNQPYQSDASAIWYYNGNESVNAIPSSSITDWVVVEFRDAPSASQATGVTRVSRQAAFVKNDGTVVGLDGISPVAVNGNYQYNLYVIIWHRNHLGVMSATPIQPAGINVYAYDFTSGPGQAYQNGQTDLGGGMYGMISGDCSPDGVLNSTDHSSSWTVQAGNTGYMQSDLNLDSQSDNRDKDDLWVPNNGLSIKVPN